ncbi:MAG TPA: FAD-dependent oxidoreductase [Actinomycetota bacterium]|nr:FAD-dependent oxidoreductase [Actinomycetota bacterium]
MLVIGGSDAGISASLRARELDPATDVTMVVADAYPNFSICGIPFHLSGETPDWRDLAHRTREEIEASGLVLRLETRAVHVDVRERSVTLRGPGGAEESVAYDRLVIGTGALPIEPPIDGLREDGVHLLHSMDDTFALRDRLEGARSAVVVGGGYIGLEMADALSRRSLEVTLLEQAPAVMTTVDVELGALIGDELTTHGVDVRTSAFVRTITRTGLDGRLAVTGDGFADAEGDVVLVVVGVRPDSALAREAGIETGIRGAIRVDTRMRTNVPGVYAAGDCVETWHRVLRRPAYLPLGTTAHKQGRIAGENAVGGDREFEGSLGTQVVKVFDLAVARTGLRDADAGAGAGDAGFEPVTIHFEAWDHKVYYPGATRMSIRTTGDRRDGRLLGAQIVGHHRGQVAKRIDVFATALFNGMAVDDLSDLDLSYTPPLSSPWDPVQMAAQHWVRESGASSTDGTPSASR